MEYLKNCGVFFPIVNPQLSFKCPIMMSGLQSAPLDCAAQGSHCSDKVLPIPKKYSALQHLHSTEASPRHLLCPGIYGNILIKEPEKDLSTTVTLATLAHRRRSGINRNCFQYTAQITTEMEQQQHPPGHHQVTHIRLMYKHCCFSPQLKTCTGGSFLATTKMKGASEA